MQITVSSSTIQGSVMAPSSKSFAQRALASALLAEGTTILRNPSTCDDALAALKVIKLLGANVDDFGDRLIIEGGLAPKVNQVNLGESGLGTRLFASILALNNQEIVLTGKGSIIKRPMQAVEQAINAAGGTCSSNNGFLPLRIQGPLRGGEFWLDGSLSSQVLTGLLMALPLAPEDSTIHVKNLQSIPYIDMTIQVMDHFCITGRQEGYQTFYIPGRQKYHANEFFIEGDWSGASFLLVAGALSGRIDVKGLNINSLQADKKVLDALISCGAGLEISDGQISTFRNELKAFEFDANHCPDLFPPLVALAAFCEGKSRIIGVNRLIHKESNRSAALVKELKKMGVPVKVEDNQMIIIGKQKIQKAEVDSHNDHRIAMATAVIGTAGGSEVKINDYECINKSYPGFFNDLKLLGGHIHE